MQLPLATRSADGRSTSTASLAEVFRPRSLDCGRPLTVKEEPPEEEEDDDEGMVIDLTPSSCLLASYASLHRDKGPDKQRFPYHEQGPQRNAYSPASKTFWPKDHQGGENFQQGGNRSDEDTWRSVQSGERSHQGSDKFQQGGERTHQGSEGFCQGVDKGFIRAKGNIPNYLHAIDDGGGGGNSGSVYSDSETSSQDSERVAGGKKETCSFSIPHRSLPVSSSQPRAKREFVPDHKKDTQYWSKRSKNNLSARRSRFKRKTLEKVMEMRMMELNEENIKLRYELNALKKMFGDKVTTDVTSSSPARSPTSSSGIGTSKSSSSSSGSADHSTSSSPAFRMDEDKPKKVVGFQLKVKLATVEKERASESKLSAGFQFEEKLASRDKRRAGDEPLNPDGSDSGLCPPLNAHAYKNSSPAAHGHFLPSHSAHTASSSPTASDASSHLALGRNSPPPAHSSSAVAYASFMSALSGLANPSPLFARHNPPNDFLASAAHNLVAFTHRLAYSHGTATSEASSGSDDLGPLSFTSERKRYCPPRAESSSGSPGSPSEDDGSSSSWSKRSWRGSQEEEDLHKIPLKCRMKRELHAALHAAGHSPDKDAAPRW